MNSRNPISIVRKAFRFLRKRILDIIESVDIAFHRNVFVFGAPYHSNAGDQAQTYCIEKWCKGNYPKYKTRIYDTKALSYRHYEKLKRVHKWSHKQDKCFLHSGYHTTDLYMFEENMQREVIRLFSANQIIMLPQTIYYHSETEKEKAKEIYNSHQHLLILCRDRVSFQTAGILFDNCRRYLFPDIVTTLIGTYHYNYARQGILLCTRNDKEGLISESEREKILSELNRIDTVDQTDTTLPINAKEFTRNRKDILESEWEKYAHYKLVVTDRYHGIIFSLISNTPVVVISSTDHKLESGVKWFTEVYKDYITYCPDIRELSEIVQDFLLIQRDYKLSEYFNSQYYGKLKSIIEENA